MTKRQRREAKLGNALRAAARMGVIEGEPGEWGIKNNKAGRGIFPRIQRHAERVASHLQAK